MHKITMLAFSEIFNPNKDNNFGFSIIITYNIIIAQQTKYAFT